MASPVPSRHATFVHDNKGWGLAAADRGELIAINNTIAYNDQVGLLFAASGTGGVFANNVVAFNGANATGAYTPQTFGRGGVRGAPPATSPFTYRDDVLFENQLSDWITADAQAEVPSSAWGSTVRAVDPMLVSRTDLRPQPGSPLLGAGDPTIKNADGSPSDIGATGGPYAGVTDL